jgi:hypothetical protein
MDVHLPWVPNLKDSDSKKKGPLVVGPLRGNIQKSKLAAHDVIIDKYCVERVSIRIFKVTNSDLPCNPTPLGYKMRCGRIPKDSRS